MSQVLANTMWAYAILSHASPEWKRHDVSAKVCHASPAFFDAIADITMERLKNFHSRSLGNTVSDFAKAGHASLTCFDAITHELEARVKDWAFFDADEAVRCKGLPLKMFSFSAAISDLQK
eukprot:10131996-Karenia_brevis.AAC.1